jgi:hypothetical protein
MVGPALPNKATWAEFKAERNDFEEGTTRRVCSGLEKCSCAPRAETGWRSMAPAWRTRRTRRRKADRCQ